MKARWLMVGVVLLLVFSNLSSSLALASNFVPTPPPHRIFLPFIFNESAPVQTGMALIPAGAFHMGCDSAHNDNFGCAATPNELPLHPIFLDAYYIDINLVTNAQYAGCVAARACAAPLHNSSFVHPSYYGNPAYASYPVIWVNWTDAAAYCTWVKKRLPSEAEWEKAARGASDTRAYPWGDQSPTCTLANFFGGDAGCVGDTSQVGSYPAGASPYGLLDMAGNVSEWVNDWYQSDYYSNSPANNPPGPATGDLKVLRGGNWEDFELFGYLRIAHRRHVNPAQSDGQTGFRCAAAAGK